MILQSFNSHAIQCISKHQDFTDIIALRFAVNDLDFVVKAFGEEVR